MCYPPPHALKLQPDSAKTLARLGDVHAQNGNLNLAVDFFKKAIDTDPLDLQNHLKFANALVLQKKYDQASRHLQKAVRNFLKHQRNNDAQKLKQLLENIKTQAPQTPR